MPIDNQLNQIMTAVYGKDVRQAIHDAIQQCYIDAGNQQEELNASIQSAQDTLSDVNAAIEQLNIKAETFAESIDEPTLTSVSQLTGSHNTYVPLTIHNGQTVCVCASNMVFPSSSATDYYVALHKPGENYNQLYQSVRVWELNLIKITATAEYDMVVIYYTGAPSSAPRITAWIDGSVPVYKSMSILGDSYSAFDGTVPNGNNKSYPYNDVTDVHEMWWHRLANQYGCAVDVNESYSGAPICYDGWDTGTSDAENSSFITRMRYLPQSELILILGGQNDSGAGAALGDYVYTDWTNEQLTMFRPALSYMLDYLIETHPGARIVFIKNNSDVGADYLTSIDTVCAYYGVTVVALQNIDKQNNHPTRAGMREIAAQVLDTLVTVSDSQQHNAMLPTIDNGNISHKHGNRSAVIPVELPTRIGANKAEVAEEIDNLKSAITGPSYNLYAGKISNALITASGVVGASTSGNSLYYAPVEEGKIYSFRLNETTTNSHGGFFENKPEKASVTYNGGRVTFTASGNIVAPITGWFAYLETDNFTQPQINAGQILLPYPSDITAIDSTARVKIDNLDGVEEGTLNYSIATTVSDGAGKYIRHTGSVASNNSLNYTDPVDIAPEFTIKVKAAGSSSVNNVSIISKYENGVFIPLVLNYNGNSPTEYTYTAHEAEKIVISYLISASLEVKITGNVINSILNINELVKYANSSLSGSPLQMFTDLVCCGDSLTYSAVFSDATHSRQAFVPWPTQIERSYGIQTIIQAQSGMNPKTWFESYGNTIAQSSAGNRLYITYFGHNASTQYPYTDTFETDCPADADPATWADTLTGWWGRIINDIYAAGCKALIIRVSDSNGYRATQDAIIEDIAARWNVPVIDNPYLPDTIYHSATDSYANEAHYNDLGYMAFCRQLMTNINKMSLTDLGHLLPSD